MRIFLPNVITPEEALSLAESPGGKNSSVEHPVAIKLAKLIGSQISADWSSPSYSRVERGGNHKWHVDTGGDKGSTGHMSWCSYGCSVLLTDDKDAGFLEYRDGHKVLPEEHYCGLAIHSSDIEHRVASTPGKRVTFLAFVKALEKKNKND